MQSLRCAVGHTVADAITPLRANALRQQLEEFSEHSFGLKFRWREAHQVNGDADVRANDGEAIRESRRCQVTLRLADRELIRAGQQIILGVTGKVAVPFEERLPRIGKGGPPEQ